MTGSLRVRVEDLQGAGLRLVRYVIRDGAHLVEVVALGGTRSLAVALSFQAALETAIESAVRKARASA